MSGGSLSYLYAKGEEAIGYKDDFKEALEALEGRGWGSSKAAEEIREIIRRIEHLEERVSDDQLSRLLHDVEWWLSADYGPESADEAVAKYEGANLVELEKLAQGTRVRLPRAGKWVYATRGADEVMTPNRVKVHLIYDEGTEEKRYPWLLCEALPDVVPGLAPDLAVSRDSFGLWTVHVAGKSPDLVLYAVATMYSGEQADVMWGDPRLCDRVGTLTKEERVGIDLVLRRADAGHDLYGGVSYDEE